MQPLLPRIAQSFANASSSTPSSAPASRIQSPKGSQRAVAPEIPPGEEKQPATAVAQSAQTNITFRRDQNGRVYYVLTDASSGKELEELPPEEVRKAGQGIEDYLKQQQARVTTHVEVKA